MLIYLIGILITVVAIVFQFTLSLQGQIIWAWIVAAVFWIICFISTILNTFNIIDYITKIDEHARNKKVSEEKYEAIKLIVKEHAEKIITEVDMLKSFEPRFLLSLPQIQSNEVIMEQIKIAMEYQNEVFKKEELINGRKQGLDWYAKAWLLAPRLVSPKYEEST